MPVQALCWAKSVYKMQINKILIDLQPVDMKKLQILAKKNMQNFLSQNFLPCIMWNLLKELDAVPEIPSTKPAMRRVLICNIFGIGFNYVTWVNFEF